MGQASDQLGLPYHFHFYDKKNYNSTQDEAKLNFKPSLENRLIYNIFGCIDNEDSLILSYDDLFEFLQRIFNNYKLPKTIEEAIFEANCFVFVGFNYSKWYLKLLLRLMKMHEKVRKVFGMDEPLRAEIETFFVNEFDMNFTRLNTIDFIDDLYQKCEEEGILLEAGAPSNTKLPAEIYKQATTELTNGKLENALQQLLEHDTTQTMPQEFSNRLKLLHARFKKLKEEQSAGVLSHEQSSITYARINKDVLEFSNDYRP